tara:strand:- start:159 stop:1742 length:1584 start_codon:yes stop_codon:yes gene_type:complete
MDEYKWYSRDREYSYGDYKVIDGKGMYYNEDSNKWNSWIGKKNIIEKYIRYEFSCFDDKEIEREFGYSEVDRVGKYLFLIYRKSIERYRRDGKKWIYIDKDNDEIKLLGNGKSNEIRNRLIDIGLIESKVGKVSKYGKEVRLYKLNYEFINCEKRSVFIRNSKVIRLLDKRYDSIVNDDEFVKWEIKSCKKLNIIDNENGRLRVILKRLNDRMKSDFRKLDYEFIGKREKKKLEREWDDDRRDEYVDRCNISFDLLKSDLLSVKEGGIENSMFSIDNFSGRLYNIVCNREKEFRSYLRFDKSKLIEVDMTNGYISLLCRVFKGIRDVERSSGNNGLDDKIKEIVGSSNGNDFLNMYEDVCFKGNDRNDFYKYVGLSKLGMFGGVSKDDRNYIKELVLYILNGKVDFSLNKKFVDGRFSIVELGERIFGKDGFECIEKIKNSDVDFKMNSELYGYNRFKNMSKLLGSMEVLIMRNKWRKLIEMEIDYVSLFDGFLIGIDYKESVMKIMNEENSIDSVVKFRVDKEYVH